MMLSGLALAQDHLMQPEEHFECYVPGGSEPARCWQAKSIHDAGYVCLDTACSALNNPPVAASLHVHVEPATTVSESAPWADERVPALTPEARTSPNTYARSPGTVDRNGVRVYGPTTHQSGGNGSFDRSLEVVGNWDANESWVAEVRGQNARYENEANLADQRADEAEARAAAAEYSRQKALVAQRRAQARSRSLASDLNSALDAGGGLLDENDRLAAELAEEQARLRALQETTTEEEK